MAKSADTFDPDSPNDVSEFLQLLFELHQRGRTGVDQGAALAVKLAGSDRGKRLLHNAHRVVSAQIGKSAVPEIFRAQQWIQKLTGMFGGGPA